MNFIRGLGSRITLRELLLLVAVGLAWPAGNEIRKIYFSGTTLQRNEQVAIAEHECKIRKFTVFIAREKSLFSTGWYILYEGARNFTGDGLKRLSRETGMKPVFEQGGLINYGYFGDEVSLNCLQDRMKTLGYTYRDHIQETNGYRWLPMDQVK